MDRKKIIVIALGGNALIREGERGTIHEQFSNTQKSIVGIVHCIKKGFEVVITHGNGPQVGDMCCRYRRCNWIYDSANAG